MSLLGHALPKPCTVLIVAKYMGGGVLVYFGYPQAHVDDAERAVRAGLELISALTGLKTRASPRRRIGIATGLVVAQGLTGPT